ncbi:hypothetical protein EJA71_10035 [Pseudomonas sp. PB106]|nr:hypothetical protein EJA71_10035 [Pseudomonas sp. PB106]
MARPTGFGSTQILWAQRSFVGVSLLAIAVYQSALMLNDTPLSRAGSLLQLFWGAFIIRLSHQVTYPA